MKSRKPFLLRISPGLYREIEAWAQEELRSVNGQIEYVLQEAVRRRRRGRRAGDEPPAGGSRVGEPDGRGPFRNHRSNDLAADSGGDPAGQPRGVPPA